MDHFSIASISTVFYLIILSSMSLFTCLVRYLSHTPIMLSNKQTLERVHDLLRCADNIVDVSLQCDRWIASSLLQKSIRRGDVEVAQRAACMLHAFDRSAIWRRLIVVACEDVGAGNIDALLESLSRGHLGRSSPTLKSRWLTYRVTFEVRDTDQPCESGDM